MKLIVAIIPPEDVEIVQNAIGEAGASLISVTEIQYGPDQSVGSYRGVEYRVMPVRLRLEIVQVNEALVPDLIEAIETAAYGPDSVDGAGCEIFVLELDRLIRFRAGQHARRYDRPPPRESPRPTGSG